MEELTYPLFLKKADDRQLIELDSRIPDALGWQSVARRRSWKTWRRRWSSSG